MNTAGDAVLLARVTVSLLVVLLLAVLVARLARRTVLRGQGRSLQVLERMPLTRESSVAVVSVAGRGLVLGVTAQAVRVLGELDAETLSTTYPAPQEPPSGAVRRPRLLPGPRAPRGRVNGGPNGGPNGGEVAGVEVGPDGVKVTRLPDGARPPAPRGTGSVLDPRTWRQAVEAVRDLTVRRR